MRDERHCCRKSRPSFRVSELGDHAVDALSADVLVFLQLGGELDAQLVQAADHPVDRTDRSVAGDDGVSVALAQRRDVLRVFEVLPLPMCRPCSSASTGRWLTPAHPRDLAMTTTANRGLRLLAAGHAIYVGTHTSRAAYHRRVNTGRHPPPRLPLVPLWAANRSFESFELFSYVQGHQSADSAMLAARSWFMSHPPLNLGCNLRSSFRSSSR